MFQTAGPVLVLAGDDLPRLERALVDAIRHGWLERHAAPPRVLVELADAAVRAAALQRSTPPRRGPLPLAHVALQPLGHEGWLSTREAATEAGVGEACVRRHCRSGTIPARRAASGEWRVDAAGLRVWTANRAELQARAEAA